MKTEIVFFAAGYVSATLMTIFMVFQYLRVKEKPSEVIEEPTIKESLQVEELIFEEGLIYKFSNGDYFCCEKLEKNIDSLICASGYGFSNGDFIKTKFIGCNEDSFKQLKIVSAKEWNDYIDDLCTKIKK